MYKDLIYAGDLLGVSVEVRGVEKDTFVFFYIQRWLPL